MPTDGIPIPCYIDKNKSCVTSHLPTLQLSLIYLHLLIELVQFCTWSNGTNTVKYRGESFPLVVYIQSRS